MKDEDVCEIDNLEDINEVDIFDPYYLHTVSLAELYDTSYAPKREIVEGILTVGAYVLVGAPKIGKSFMCAQLAYHVSTGLPLWDRKIDQGVVLYLALEDTLERIQRRLYRMYGPEGNDHLHIATNVNRGDQGLDKQLKAFIQRWEHVNLIIIDTLGRIRAESSGQYSYLQDYQEMAALKAFADTENICIVLVHHTRKAKADDVFEMVSGTTGILGAVDGALVLKKDDRTSLDATLDITSRDYPDQRLCLRKDVKTLTWNLISSNAEMWATEPDPILNAVSRLVSSDHPTWTGAPQELAALIESELRPNMLTRHINVNTTRLLEDYNIKYVNRRTHDGRRITLSLLPEIAHTGDDGVDGDDVCDSNS